MKIKYICLSILLISLSETLVKGQGGEDPFNQQGFNNEPEPVIEEPCRELYDSNSNLIVPLKDFALVYFFSEKKKDSLILKDLLGQVKLKYPMPYFCINIDTNKDMMKAFDVVDVPSIVILQHRRIIYATIGFTKDANELTNILNYGIENNLLIEQRNQ